MKKGPCHWISILNFTLQILIFRKILQQIKIVKNVSIAILIIEQELISSF